MQHRSAYRAVSSRFTGPDIQNSPSLILLQLLKQIYRCTACSFLTHFISVHERRVLVQRSVRPAGTSPDGERSQNSRLKCERMLMSCIFMLLCIMHGRVCSHEKEKLCQTSVRLQSAGRSFVPGIHLPAEHRPYWAQIEWAASKWNELERQGALIKNLSGS